MTREADHDSAHPAWAWTITGALCLATLTMASATGVLIAWEIDRAELEEHRSLLFASAISHITTEHGDYYAQRFIDHLAANEDDLVEAFVIADGGTDEFGISRGQAYSATSVRGDRNKTLDSFVGEDRHKTRADRFSRSTAGRDITVKAGRAHPALVLEIETVDGSEVYAAQVPVTVTADLERADSAGATLAAAVPPPPVPWLWLVVIGLAATVLLGLALHLLALRTPAARTGMVATALALATVAQTALLWTSYTSSYDQQIDARLADVDTLAAAAEYAQIRGDDLANLIAAADVEFTGERGFLLSSFEVTSQGPQLNSARPTGGRRIVAVGSLLFVVLLALGLHRFVVRVVSACRDQGWAYVYVLPSIVGMLLLVFVPFAFGIGLSFFDNDARRYYFVGAANFVEILSGDETSDVSFYWTLFVTILWTVCNVVLHVGIGLALALMLKDPLLRFRRIYRVLLIVPWAIPNYITALIWKAMFNKEFGAVNAAIGSVQELFGYEPSSIDWLGGSFMTAFIANLTTNTWLGFPFMMVVALGALQSIPGELYEAADVDGASPWQKFRLITAPLLKPALFPAIILGTIWTFNMFNVIYLVSGGGPNNLTEILITDAYRAFDVLGRHGFAAAYSVVIFLILLTYTVMTNRITKATEGAFD